MQEKEIIIPLVDPLEFYGTADSKLKLIKKRFPKLKIVARGATIKVFGDPSEITRFEKQIDLIFWHLEKYQTLSERELEKLLGADPEEIKSRSNNDAVLVYGPGGNQIKAKTPNQRKLVKAAMENDMVFAIGPAGTGKTYTAVALAVRALKEKEVKRIILTRPAVEAGENLGFLPGDLKEKLDPYMQPLYDGLMDMLPYEKLADYIEKGTIEVAPLAFMRGRTLDKAYVILDEAQNTTVAQMKMFLTRMGQNAKFVINGDASQVDLPKKQMSGLIYAQRRLSNIEGISFIQLSGKDVIRHPLVGKIINAFEEEDKEREREQNQ
ncbi:MAG: PhoH family protein, partial [Bacteroidota bacterium]